jgi:hypothetical protein
MQSKQSTLDQSNSPTPESPADTDFDETDDSSLRLSYQNEIGNAIVIRKYQNHTEFVRETDEEWMYNYRLGEWECVHRFVHDYDLSDDGETTRWRRVGTGVEPLEIGVNGSRSDTTNVCRFDSRTMNRRSLPMSTTLSLVPLETRQSPHLEITASNNIHTRVSWWKR